MKIVTVISQKHLEKIKVKFDIFKNYNNVSELEYDFDIAVIELNSLDDITEKMSEESNKVFLFKSNFTKEEEKELRKKMKKCIYLNVSSYEELDELIGHVVTPKKIMIVEDEEGLRENLESLFQYISLNRAKKNLNTVELFLADGGNPAFEILKKEKIDVILTDINMDNGSGLELIDNIGESLDYKPKVYVMSGFTKNTEKIKRYLKKTIKSPGERLDMNKKVLTWKVEDHSDVKKNELIASLKDSDGEENIYSPYEGKIVKNKRDDQEVFPEEILGEVLSEEENMSSVLIEDYIEKPFNTVLVLEELLRK